MDVLVRMLRQRHLGSRVPRSASKAPHSALVHPGDWAGRVGAEVVLRRHPIAVTSTKFSGLAECSLSKISPVTAPGALKVLSMNATRQGLHVQRRRPKSFTWPSPSGGVQCTRWNTPSAAGSSGDDGRRRGSSWRRCRWPGRHSRTGDGQMGCLNHIDKALGSHVDAVRRDIDDAPGRGEVGLHPGSWS